VEHTLCVGIPKGRARPALWFTGPHGETSIIAQFHSTAHAQALVAFLDEHGRQVQNAINHHNKGDTNAG